VTSGYRYVIYGIVVQSEFRLTSVEEASDKDAEPVIAIALGSTDYFREKAPELSSHFDDWIKHVVLADGSVYIAVEEVFETIVSADGRRVVCARLGDIDDRSFEANVMNFVVSTALTLWGEEPLHATVVDIAGRAVGLLGPSGAGKSTLAACLIAQGADLITDDMLRVTFAGGAMLAHAGPYRLKLFDEPARLFLPQAAPHGYFNGLSGKVMVQPRSSGRSLRSPQPLSALFWLGEPQPTTCEVSARRMSGTALAKALIASAMNVRYLAPARLARQLRFAERVAHMLPVYALRYPRRFEVMDLVIEEIRKTARPVFASDSRGV
jgi:hypothetical protein